MHEKLENLIEELSLLAAMLHEADEPGFQMTLESCSAIYELVKESKEHEALAKATNDILELGKTEDRKALFHALQAFATTLQSYIRDPKSVKFPGADTSKETATAGTGWGKDLSPDFDAELLVEFINVHTSRLDEFESELLQAAGSGEKRDGRNPELDLFLKGYLHNVKGEAGTVGLSGIAEATHYMEDLVLERGALAIVDQLLAYKEWLLSCMQACSKSVAPTQLSHDFLDSIKATVEKKPAQKAQDPKATPEPAETYMLTGEDEVLGEFFVEAEDHLNGVEEALLDRHDSCNADDIAAFFRAIHSVKGGSAYFGLKEMTESSHLTETLLDQVRNGRVPFTQELAELLLAYLDLQKDLFATARACMKSGEPVKRTPKTAAYLERLQNQYQQLDFKGSNPPQKSASEQKSQSATPDAKKASAPSAAAPAPAADASPATPQRNEKMDVKTFLKVESGRLDQLIDYVGELVISASMLTQNCKTYLSDNEVVMKNTHQLDQILREVQYIAMSMRLVPVKGVFQKMARLVWDLSRKIGKNINFKMEGEDTELDRTVIDKISDPLMHMVRNSLDHGVESPEERTACGKPKEGTIRLRAFHKAGTVHIQITDDGRGLDHEKIRTKAIEKGIITADQNLTKQELWYLIFAPGFSTAATVTDVSGRGVGMDVVRRNIESMRGRVLIDSEIGKGTTLTIELPLTLAIMDGIETALGRERFIIPTLSIVEFLKPSREMITTSLDRSEILEFRGKFLPIFRLSHLFEVKPKFSDPTEAIMVVVEGAGEQVAIMVDDVVGKHSAVIKSLGSIFQDTKGLAGCAIMPDGYVGLILDVQSLVALARSPETSCRPVRLPDSEDRMTVVH
ncbi:MAG: hypothetical protein GX589_10350 [Deltaproteobacteria bacterium]|nr:hypothetical protein [Deltaproteobacteria bacterium]